MVRVILNGWQEGIEKISLTKIQMDILGKSLSESKNNVDTLLDDKKVIFEIDSLDLATKFLKEADKIGVNCLLFDNFNIDISFLLLDKIKIGCWYLLPQQAQAGGICL